ncbi:MAG: AbrB/MazE/SpoVT family DNA-binding domain-containing protein [Acidobacteriia bacterium]|nr:AbrB/MazE/SpoVT family DNA-binding domain-containing protein [Terriglobia bacterium]
MSRNVVCVHKWGNSRCAIIPAFILRQIKWRVGDLLYVTIEGDHLVFRPLELPKGVPRNGDGETDDSSTRRTQPGPGAGFARSEPEPDRGVGAANGGADSAAVYQGVNTAGG